jgi:pimeloyl-ACP methyl ester carboxylesterase
MTGRERMARGRPQVPPSFVSLPGGRLLAYEEFGDPSGVPVINCHGGLTSRLDVLRCGPVAERAGIRLVSPDRPGIGRSDPKPNRTLLDWPNDVAALADELGIRRFGVLGWSAGGPFAAACAHSQPERVSSVALVASTIPADWPHMARSINRFDRALLGLSLSARPVASLVVHAMRAAVVHTPAAFRRSSCTALDKPSRRIVMEEPLELYTEPIAEGLRRAEAVIEDYRILGSAWGFALEALTRPVTVWQGEDDGLVPVSWGRSLAAAIPGARAQLVPHEGHFLTTARYAEVFSVLASEASLP